MTVKEILKRLRAVKPMSKTHLYKQFLNPLNIRPVGKFQQRPQQYPDDTPERVLAVLGLGSSPRCSRNRRRNPKLKVRLTRV